MSSIPLRALYFPCVFVKVTMILTPLYRERNCERTKVNTQNFVDNKISVTSLRRAFIPAFFSIMHDPLRMCNTIVWEEKNSNRLSN